jgi:hypothetical protein
MTNYTLDDYLIVEAVCCRKWPVAYGIPMGKCGLCHEVPTITMPLVVVREQVVRSKEENEKP